MSLAVRELPAVDIQASYSFMQPVLAGSLSPNTKRSYDYVLSQFLRVVNKPAYDVTREDIYLYRQFLVNNYDPKTVNHRLSVVRKIFGEAVLFGIIAHNPAVGVKGYKVNSDYSSTKSPDEPAVRKLIESVSGDSLIEVRDRAIIYTACTLGLRRDELSRLTTDSIIVDSGKVAMEVFGKGSKRRRIEIPANTYNVLQAWILTANLQTGDALFQEIKNIGGYHLTGKALTGNGIYYVLVRRMKAVGIEGCSPHSLRRFLVTLLLDKGANIYRVQQLCGHSSTRTTEMYDKNKHGVCSSAAELIDF